MSRLPNSCFRPSLPLLFGALVLTLPGCGHGNGQLELAWGRRGLREGDFIRPRAVTISSASSQDELFIVDFTGRIQVFDRDGNYLRGWSTPTIVNGRPAGISCGTDGTILVADSHYRQVLVYTPEGNLLRTLSGKSAEGPGEFAYVSDVLQDASGNYYVVEFGDSDRIQKFDAAGRYLKHWGSHGTEPGQFARPRGAAICPNGFLYVADSCNHRIQVFDLEGNFVRAWGEEGSGPGNLRYPYDVCVTPDGTINVAEFGNHRVQRFTPEGVPLGAWGVPGRDAGCLNSPWGLAVDRRGKVHVLDTENHRVQRIDF